MVMLAAQALARIETKFISLLIGHHDVSCGWPGFVNGDSFDVADEATGAKEREFHPTAVRMGIRFMYTVLLIGVIDVTQFIIDCNGFNLFLTTEVAEFSHQFACDKTPGVRH